MSGQFRNISSNYVILDILKQAVLPLLMMGKALNILIKFRTTFSILDPEQIGGFTGLCLPKMGEGA